jgi:hypothetical protein
MSNTCFVLQATGKIYILPMPMFSKPSHMAQNQLIPRKTLHRLTSHYIANWWLTFKNESPLFQVARSYLQSLLQQELLGCH